MASVNLKRQGHDRVGEETAVALSVMRERVQGRVLISSIRNDC